jgi:hypothetical protein
MQANLDLDELNNISDKIAQLQLAPDDVSRFATGINLIVQADVDARFDSAPAVETGGTVWGDAYWKAVRPEYLEYHPRRVGGQLLRDTGELQQSFTAEGTRVYEVSDTQFTFGTALPKAARLHRDRPLIFWHPQLIDRVAEYLAIALAA